MNSDQAINQPSIVVVDDNPLILGVVRGLLQHAQFKVHACENSEQALSALSKHPVDLVICDVMMPEVSGYQLHQMIRTRPEFCNIPFVFLTALDSEDERLKGKASGADDYLTKPFDPKELLALVEGKIERSRLQRAQTEQRYESYRRKVMHTLSHEFRTPLVAINTGTELLLDQPHLEEKKLRTLVEAIQRGGLRLERLVNDFMTLQQIDAGQAKRLFETRAVTLDTEELASRVVTHVKNIVTDEGGELCVERSMLVQTVHVYEIQILDLVSRLVQNAIKFAQTPKKVTVSFLSQAADFVIQVEDNGLGFRDDQLGAMTRAFSQIDRDKFEQQGSGVGLAIASAYAEIQGATLEFSNRGEATPGITGAKVCLILPSVRR